MCLYIVLCVLYRKVGRVSYCLALNGPCVSTDTACSSSLVAAHLARRAVGVGDAAAGVAAGVNLALLHINTSVICAIGALSPVAGAYTRPLFSST